METFVTGKPIVDVKAHMFDRDGVSYGMLAVLMSKHPGIEGGSVGRSIRTVVTHRRDNIYESQRTIYRVLGPLSIHE
jgi:hypothetical protein